jgi:hypothetical protein
VIRLSGCTRVIGRAIEWLARLAAGGLEGILEQPRGDLGSSPIVLSETEAPNLLANMV